MSTARRQKRENEDDIATAKHAGPANATESALTQHAASLKQTLRSIAVSHETEVLPQCRAMPPAKEPADDNQPAAGTDFAHLISIPWQEPTRIEAMSAFR